MPLVSGTEVLKLAKRGGFAAGGFDIFDLESVRAIVAAAEAEGSPVFLQACVRSVEHMSFEQAALVMCDAAERASVPVAVHFDHGPETTCLADVARALRAGFNSVMVDGSRLPLEENIELTGHAVRLAHESGACAEGEIGQIGRITGGQADSVARRVVAGEGLAEYLTSPREASRFITETGIDYVAVAVGSMSGTESRLDLDLLRELAALIPVPLVLHGGTGVPPEDLREAIRIGITKVNIAHGLRRAYVHAFRAGLEDGRNTDDPYVLMEAAREAMEQYVRAKIRQLNSASE